MKRGLVAALFTTALLGACAGPRTTGLPEGYSGPTAKIMDSAILPGAGERIRIFYVDQVDGESVDNSLLASRRASSGKGSMAITKEVTREVPARKLKLRIAGTHMLAAPIAEIAAIVAGNFYQVAGEVEFTPEAGKSYVVMGDLAKEGSAVWIQDYQTRAIVTQKVTGGK